MRAIRNNHLITRPSLTVTLIHKHLPETIPSAQGHLDQKFKNFRLTKIITKSSKDDDIIPIQEPDNIKTNDIMCTIISTETLSNKSYLDQTGQFPINPSRGHKYIFVFYHYNTNTIMGYAIKSETPQTFVEHG